MKFYRIEVETISGYNSTCIVSSEKKPLVHEAWAWLKKKHGERSCYLLSNSVTVTETHIEPFEVVV